MIPLNEKLSPLQLSGIRCYTQLAKNTDDCVMLTIGEPDFQTPQPIKDAAWQALQDGKTHYAPNQGTLRLRQAIAEHETRRGNACTEKNILVTQGATGALFTALLGILNPGEQVIVPTPAFPLYESIIAVAGATAVKLNTAADSFQLTKDALEKAVTPKTKAIILNSPNNPTGVVYSEASLAAVKQAVLGKDIYVICDNVYQSLCSGACPDLSVDPELKGQILLCQSFSKPYAMTGWRAGYLAAPENVLSRLLLLHAAQVASVPTFVQEACVTALETDISAMAEAYKKRRQYVCARLEKMGLSFPEPDGAFYVFADISRFGMASGSFCEEMIRKARVAAVPGSCFGTEGYIRISCCCSMDDLQKGMDRLEAFIKKL